MNKELTKKLYTDFPKIFHYNRGDIHDPMLPMAFGFECGDGWYGIINHCCKMLQYDVDKNKKIQVTAAQVKEKFGSLRFYIDGGSEKSYDIIDFFESLSFIICEACGSSNATTEISSTGWVRTRCKNCPKTTP